MYSKTHLISGLFICLSCNNHPFFSVTAKNNDPATAVNTIADINPYKRINEIPLPPGFTRVAGDPNSFGAWLKEVALKKDKTVYQFNHIPKANQTAQFAVLDISVGDKDLQQCADAVMRLRAEYLFSIKKYNDIHFTDNAGTAYQFGEPFSNLHFQQYLQKVFGACGSASLAKQLKPVSFKDIEPGDVIIRGGFPGHAVIVMDVAENKDGLKLYLLAQSYMPAQDIHVLLNPIDKELSPWYRTDEPGPVETPEYRFTKNELKRW